MSEGEGSDSGWTRREVLAAAATGALGLFGALAPAVMLEPPMKIARDASATRSRRAAIGLRDHEIPFFKQGTKLYTLPSLERHYAEVAYFTQDDVWWRQMHLVTPHLTRLLTEYDAVDIFLLVHGRKRWWEWLEGIPLALASKIRLVYSTGCADASEAGEWLERGARSYVSHPGAVSASPFFYFYFLRRWLAGEQLERAVSLANARVEPILKSLGERGGLSGERLWRATRAETFGDGTIWLGEGARE